MWLQEVTPNEQARQFAAIGVLGSFTTFSTFSHETVALAHAGEVVRAGGYALGSVFIGVVAVMLGVSLATAIAGARG